MSRRVVEAACAAGMVGYIVTTALVLFLIGTKP